MFDCWKAEHEERPSFEALEEKLTKILIAQVGNVYLFGNMPFSNQCHRTRLGGGGGVCAWACSP